MRQRERSLTQIIGYRGWRVVDVWFQTRSGRRVDPPPGCEVAPALGLVLRLEPCWTARCSGCGGKCRKLHQQTAAVRRWADLPWAGRAAEIEYAPRRVRCVRCGTPPEMVAWADVYQRQTKRLQQHVALLAASSPVQHVAAQFGLDWSTVRRAEHCALTRWMETRKATPLRQVGVDEKFLGRRRSGSERFVTIVSNNETGEPLWIGFGRSEETLAVWIKTLTKEEKAGIRLFVSDMHRAFENAIRAEPELNHAVLVHDVFHVMKRAGEAMDELRREIFFRAGAEMRAIGTGKRWLLLRAWERTTEAQRADLKRLFTLNGTLARFYQVVEELRLALHAPTREAMGLAFTRIFLRTQRRTHDAIRSFHDSLTRHAPNLYALADHRPATGRVEALNNNWETVVRRGRGYRDLPYLLLKLRFAIVNPVYTEQGVKRFLALGLPPPARDAAA